MPDQQCGEVSGKILVKQYSHRPQQFRKPRQALQWQIRALLMETDAEIHQGSRRLPSNRKGSGLESVSTSPPQLFAAAQPYFGENVRQLWVISSCVQDGPAAAD